MLVAPANKLPLEIVNNGGKMVIVNKQKTPFDSDAKRKVYGDLDEVLLKLTKKLQVEIPNVTPEGISLKL
jgi:NAD-dependent SIR2 family protein deacetylase